MNIQSNNLSGNSEISVVIPTYNRTSMLIRLLNSLLYTTIPILEIIVIDGYPNSNNKEILSEKFPYVKYYNFNRISYVGELRNFGLKIALGRYVFMVDDDN